MTILRRTHCIGLFEETEKSIKKQDAISLIALRSEMNVEGCSTIDPGRYYQFIREVDFQIESAQRRNKKVCTDLFNWAEDLLAKKDPDEELMSFEKEAELCKNLQPHRYYEVFSKLKFERGLKRIQNKLARVKSNNALNVSTEVLQDAARLTQEIKANSNLSSEEKADFLSRFDIFESEIQEVLDEVRLRLDGSNAYYYWAGGVVLVTVVVAAILLWHSHSREMALQFTVNSLNQQLNNFLGGGGGGGATSVITNTITNMGGPGGPPSPRGVPSIFSPNDSEIFRGSGAVDKVLTNLEGGADGFFSSLVVPTFLRVTEEQQPSNVEEEISSEEEPLLGTRYVSVSERTEEGGEESGQFNVNESGCVESLIGFGDDSVELNNSDEDLPEILTIAGTTSSTTSKNRARKKNWKENLRRSLAKELERLREPSIWDRIFNQISANPTR